MAENETQQPSVAEQNELEKARQLQRFRALRDAAVALFGPAGKRTPHGALVLEELERFAGTRRLINEVDNHNATDVYRTARKHGRCDMIQALYDLIDWKEN